MSSCDGRISVLDIWYKFLATSFSLIFRKKTEGFIVEARLRSSPTGTGRASHMAYIVCLAYYVARSVAYNQPIERNGPQVIWSAS